MKRPSHGQPPTASSPARASTSFSPDAKVTREQLAAILYRYAQYRKLDTDASAKLNSFTDADSVSAYASEALGWAVSEGLINGASGKLMPKGRRDQSTGRRDPPPAREKCTELTS